MQKLKVLPKKLNVTNRKNVAVEFVTIYKDIAEKHNVKAIKEVKGIKYLIPLTKQPNEVVADLRKYTFGLGKDGFMHFDTQENLLDTFNKDIDDFINNLNSGDITTLVLAERLAMYETDYLSVLNKHESKLLA